MGDFADDLDSCGLLEEPDFNGFGGEDAEDEPEHEVSRENYGKDERDVD